jgi:hypothetical protein
VSFKTPADLTKYGVYKIKIYSYDNNDDYLLNDTVRISIEHREIIDSLSVYPNPVTDHFTIFISSKARESLQISLYSVSGIKMYDTKKDILAGKNEITISDFNLSPGIYYLTIRGSSIRKSIPLLKTNR